jgi:hypothetical protein
MKHIILMHGRSIKPAHKALEEMSKKAIEAGLRRAGHQAKADAFKNGDIKFSTAYYGDINNAILAGKSKKTAEKLTAKDPEHGNSACLDAAFLKEGFDRTVVRPHFDKAAYDGVLEEADDNRLLDEAADVASLIGALFTAGLLNAAMISSATADLYAYLVSHDVGSEIRSRLNTILMPAMLAGDEICLLTHSMGCIVAYDVLWKYAHMSEYVPLLNERKSAVSLWLTFGCPLGETGVQQKLLDGRYTDPKEKYPRRQIVDWLNIFAEDDFVAHVEKISPIYRRLVKDNDLRAISDGKIYNCWTYTDFHSGRLVSNPHDMYGYLMNEKLAGQIGKWLS